MTILRLIVATLLPAIVSLIVYRLIKKTGFGRMTYEKKQVIIGVLFGLVAVLATEFGIQVNGAILNVRTAAPLTAGLLFGGPAGIIAGLIGGIERWFCVYWGGGEYTRLACTLATIMAGFFAALVRKYLCDGKKASCITGFAIGLTTEVLHMLLVFVTNMNDIHTAFNLVEQCAPYMILLNACAVFLALLLVKIMSKEFHRLPENRKQIAQIFRKGLMICVFIAIITTIVFTIVLQTGISKENTNSTLATSVAEVPKALDEAVDNTIVTYTQWMADEINLENDRDQSYFEQMAAVYYVPEIYLLDKNDVVISGNIASSIGATISSETVNFQGKSEYVGSYATSVLDGETPMKYAGVTLLDDNRVLVGYDESFLTDESDKRMATLVTSRHIGEAGYLVVSNMAGEIVSASAGIEENTIQELGIKEDSLQEGSTVKTILSGQSVYIMKKNMDTLAGSYYIFAVIPYKESVFFRNSSVYLTIFMEILVFAALYMNVYFLTKRVVVDNIHKVNQSLAKITGGNLNEKVNVRENEEFASLTDDINSTVSTLKYYIAEAEARIDKELEFARQIQYAALPSVFPPYPNRKDFDIFATMKTAREVGGDFYDFYLLDQKRLGFLIADVSGKGIPAAMFMMTAKTAIKGLAESGLSVEEIFTRTNATLSEENDAGMFVTAWMGILDLETGHLDFANAGHNPPLIRHKNGTFEYLRTRPNLVLAGMDQTRYKKHTMELLPGDEIYLYTDGVTEAKNKAEEMFMEGRLQEVLNEHPEEGVEKRCNRVMKEVQEFAGEAEQFDDITMLSVKLSFIESPNTLIVYPDLESAKKVWDFEDVRIDRDDISRKLAAKIKICTDELYTNIFKYSHATRAEISLCTEYPVLKLMFRDNGDPFDPTKVGEPDTKLSLEERQPGGLGIMMVKKSSQSLAYEYIEGENQVTVTFDISK